MAKSQAVKQGPGEGFDATELEQAQNSSEEVGFTEGGGEDEGIITEEDLELARRNVTSRNEREFALKAMQAAFCNGVFDDDITNVISWSTSTARASEQDLTTYEDWEKRLKSYIRHAEENTIDDYQMAVSTFQHWS
ncbi:hypothetical protein EYR38_010697 [Pleurotus pulmonarius]|nr:hypothetical protein EYR38_010697 [Pleurotus pulmonarius]